MAVVLDALAPYLIQTIKDMAEDELRMLLGISGDIQRLSEKMKKMEAYLADAERRRIDDPTVQDWVNQLKGAMYEATDILDLCQLDAEERKKRSPGGCWPNLEKKAPGCLQPLLFCLRNPSFARSMGKRIKALNVRLDEISNEMSRFEFVKMNSYQVKTLTSEVTPHSRVTTSLIDESAIVGDAIQAATRALVQVLLADEPATILVVSIVGAGGMGKTTLAKMIFNDRDIQMAFRSKIWLSVTETYEEKKLLSSSIAQAGGGKEPASEDKEVLTKTLADVLSSSTGKVLVVMDDVWSEHPWTDVLQSPIIEAARKQPGSRVILTTRNENLVKYMGATCHQHHVKPLGDEDAWSLLKKQVQPQATSSASDLDHLKHIGMGIIRKCDGLPLAIKAVGGLLKTKKGNENDWKEVLDAPAWSTDKTHHDLNSALRLSYEDLPPPLKQCFLYYSLLPKGLHVDMVIGLWMSEGLVVSQEDRDRWKEAEDVSMATDISRLPDDIDNMRFLEHIRLVDCPNFDGQLPSSIKKLERLRGWCSLQELGTLSLLRRLELLGLEAVPNASLAAQAKLHDKEQLRVLCLVLGNSIDRYESIIRRSLTGLDIMGMPFCTQLPDGLCRLPSLESLIIRFAPAIKRVGPEFQRRIINSLVPPFPRLQWLNLDRLLEWDNWEWEDDVKEDAEVTAMPALETLIIRECKLHCLPPGLASSNRRALKKLYLIGLVNLSSVHNIPSVVELKVFDCPKLMKISGFSSLRKIKIVRCPNLKVLQDAQKLDILVLADTTMETLPGYLWDVKPRYLHLRCNKKLYESLVSAGTSECDKIRHITTRYYYVIKDNKR
ncbi:hypothetical protein U9M48_041488 [Paspalum notatum var. saurae]|uniref:Disease resistance protein n=1 Tax=Paspalum notatum var. saurae TaxID=547442 RepID=A0AAQ3UQJ6_PASNO